MYDKPTWWLFGNWYGWPPISSMWNPSGNITAAVQNRTTVKFNEMVLVKDLGTDVRLESHLLAVNPTHLAYGMTSLSQLLLASKMMVVVMQIQPTKIQINANSHSGWSSGVKQTCGLLWRVMQVHISPSLVSPTKLGCCYCSQWRRNLDQNIFFWINIYPLRQSQSNRAWTNWW